MRSNLYILLPVLHINMSTLNKRQASISILCSNDFNRPLKLLD